MPLVMQSSLRPLSNANVGGMYLPCTSLGEDLGMREPWPTEAARREGVQWTGQATTCLSLITTDPWMEVREGSLFFFLICTFICK